MKLRPSLLLAATVLTSASHGQNLTDQTTAQLAPFVRAVATCYREHATRFAAQTCEPIATVVDAALGACGSEESAYKVAAVRIGGEVYTRIGDGIISGGREKSRQGLLGLAIESRISAGKCVGISN